MNLTDFQKKLAWGVGILSIICLWIAFPLIFKALIESYKFPEKFNSFGPFGDIYGSLNTLISSIALCAVAYSTWLQVTSLKETRETNIKQLKLAEDSHNEQLNESRNAIFANQFYSLLNYKLEKYKSLEFECKISRYTQEGKKVNGLGVLQILTSYFSIEIEKNPKLFMEKSEADLRLHFMTITLLFFKEPISPLLSYFYIYKNLLNLIKDSKLNDQDKAVYLDILCNSMFLEEQMVLFWISPIFTDLKKSIEDSRLFNQMWYDDSLKEYALKFHKKHTFRTTDWINVFDEEINENPA